MITGAQRRILRMGPRKMARRRYEHSRDLRPADYAAIRRVLGLTGPELADALGVGLRTVRGWEGSGGVVARPTLRHRAALAALFRARALEAASRIAGPGPQA